MAEVIDQEFADFVPVLDSRSPLKRDEVAIPNLMTVITVVEVGENLDDLGSARFVRKGNLKPSTFGSMPISNSTPKPKKTSEIVLKIISRDLLNRI
ncbi:hypothetical protein GMOD_00007380 [Pyrenophora seminiperda CCB06]|uniref:Uncharacterized protein n=1 Tax=Pyrenophora seminiperda CCB06 TaxID=1302712 RepID=A0A3M7MCZ4_9PLEO|nr:hypothetical protein GMOD_00007380 [Pyrenophora seminiperda CCB06]